MNTLRFITKDVNSERYCFVMKASKTECVCYDEFVSRYYKEGENCSSLEEAFEAVLENLALKPVLDISTEDGQYSLQIYEAEGTTVLIQDDFAIEIFNDNSNIKEVINLLLADPEYNNRTINKILKDNIDEVESILGYSIGFMFCEEE